MIRRFRLTPVAGSGAQNGLIITLPPPSPAPDPTVCETCPTVPPLAEWVDLPTLFPCVGSAPAEATIDSAGTFVAAPGVDTSTTYEWEIDTTGMTLPHVCVVVPDDEAVLVDNFRYMSGAGTPIQEDPPDNSIRSPYFLLRPNEPLLPLRISTYQRGASWGDPTNGLNATVRFRVLCIPVAPT